MTVVCFSPDPYDTRDVPFHSMALNQKATKLVVMPLASFHRLAGEIGDPKYAMHQTLKKSNLSTRC